MSYVLICTFDKVQNQINSQNIDELTNEFKFYVERDLMLLNSLGIKNIDIQKIYDNYKIYKICETKITHSKYVSEIFSYDNVTQKFVNVNIKQKVSEHISSDITENITPLQTICDENIREKEKKQIFEVACDKLQKKEKRIFPPIPELIPKQTKNSITPLINSMHSDKNNKSDDDMRDIDDFYGREEIESPEIKTSSDESTDVTDEFGFNTSDCDDVDKNSEIAQFRRQIREIRKLKKQSKENLKKQKKEIELKKQDIVDYTCEVNAQKALDRINKEKEEKSRNMFNTNIEVYKKFNTAIHNGEASVEDIPPFFIKSFEVYAELESEGKLEDEHNFELFMEKYKQNAEDLSDQDDPYGIFQ